MSDKPRITRKIEDMPNPEEGQGFCHDVPSNMDWEETLDMIHFVLLNKWFYVSLASNTKKGLFGPKILPKNRINIQRKKKEVPEELESLLKLKGSSFNKLSKKIEHQQKMGGNKDIWHFKGKWEEFPNGTSIIEIRQQPTLNKLSNHPIYRKAFIILDGQSDVEQQHNAMRLINKILTHKEYAKKLRAKVKTEKPKENAVTKRPSAGVYQGRPVTDLALKLQEAFGVTVRTLSIDEEAALRLYFNKLEERGELSDSMRVVRTKFNDYYDNQ